MEELKIRVPLFLEQGQREKHEQKFGISFTSALAEKLPKKSLKWPMSPNLAPLKVMAENKIKFLVPAIRHPFARAEKNSP